MNLEWKEWMTEYYLYKDNVIIARISDLEKINYANNYKPSYKYDCRCFTPKDVFGRCETDDIVFVKQRVEQDCKKFGLI